ncbi:hypothetical protein Q5424_24840 [Conexibacter sp. JD483]|uniref:hypothetical protein n=1 Tax=unclassified Conexibacter TaxID=2627773 RepID=UPI00271DD9AD|nr:MULTISPECIES: hypothetical protein [unclassified Conexibacter]MDO8188434.1 hypothetical protein [Conexibacter sp. CPCC 205706]MDO8199205.1 hypothetical protein [Conexibacter sp. CPCC 205762]MDR9372349.1 hypothetical protein [Conexibacter sp. JD483]
MPISPLRRSLDAALLDFAWSEWAQMGVLASAPRRSPWAEDPEALVVFTLEVARDDPRLFDELLDWLLRNEPLVSVRRLRSFAVDPEDRRLVDGALTWLDAHRPRARLRGRRQPQPSGEPVPLFTESGFPMREPDPSFLSAGLVRPPVEPSGKSQAPDLRAPINFAFRLRQVLGLGARAEVVRLLLTSAAPSMSTADLGAGAGYARRNVLDAVGALQEGGVVPAVRGAGGQRFAIDRGAWAALLGLDAEQLPEARAWSQLLGALVRVRRWLRDVESEELSDYMRASRARDLLETIAPPLSIAGVEVAVNPGVELAWPEVERTVASALGALGGSGPALQPARRRPQAKRSAGAVERLGR